MDTILKRLCEAHRLTTISVMLLTAAKVHPFSVYVHWAEGECTSGSGDTVEAALAMALAEMAERRDREAAA